MVLDSGFPHININARQQVTSALPSAPLRSRLDLYSCPIYSILRHRMLLRAPVLLLRLCLSPFLGQSQVCFALRSRHRGQRKWLSQAKQESSKRILTARKNIMTPGIMFTDQVFQTPPEELSFVVGSIWRGQKIKGSSDPVPGPQLLGSKPPLTMQR